MDRSIYLARLIGPVFMAVGLGILINSPFYRAMAEQALGQPVLIYITGVLTLLGGLALVLAHNIWDGSWRVIISAIGWIFVAGGLCRILMPQQLIQFGSSVTTNGVFPVGAALVILVLGAALSYFGYADIASPKSRTRTRKRSR